MSSAPGQSPRLFFFKALAVVALALGAMWLLLSSHQPQMGGLATGRPMPPIKAAGWLNGPAPKPGELAGKVLVIDVWASWCEPCLRQAPEMVHLHEKYHDQGVEFIGLTIQPEAEIPQMERFLKRTGITWRNGYGAEETLLALGAEMIPMVWVIDRQQRIVGSYESSSALEEGIRQAVSSE